MKLLLASALAATLSLPASPALADSGKFLTKAIKGDNSEMTLGGLAAKLGRSLRVRRFGVMLVRDHRRAKMEASPIARRHGVVIPASMAPEARHEYVKLQGMRGIAFDREFARYMVDDHRKDIADFETEVASGDPADVRALARRSLPTLRKHLATARSL